MRSIRKDIVAHFIHHRGILIMFYLACFYNDVQIIKQHYLETGSNSRREILQKGAAIATAIAAPAAANAYAVPDLK